MSRSHVYRTGLLILCGGVLLAGVAGNSPVFGGATQQEQQDGESAKKPMRQPTDFRKLKEYFPKELSGLKRVSAEGQSMNLGETKMSQAEANYGDDAATIHIVLTDYAAEQGIIDAMTAWQSVEIDSESDTGYEKTTKVEGYPAMETFDAPEGEAGYGTYNILVEGVLIVQVSASGMSKADFQALNGKLELKKLGQIVAPTATTRPVK